LRSPGKPPKRAIFLKACREKRILEKTLVLRPEKIQRFLIFAGIEKKIVLLPSPKTVH